MPHTCIPVNSNSDFVGLLYHCHELFLCTPFCCLSSLLIELAQVIQIIDIVAVARGRGSFASGRDPDVVDTGSFELGDVVVEPNPMLMVVRNIPFKALHHGHILRSRSLL